MMQVAEAANYATCDLRTETMIIDIIFLFILALAAFKGFRQGLVLAAFSFAAFFIGLAAAIKLSAMVAVWLEESFQKPSAWWPFLAFALVLLIVSGLVRAAAALVSKTLDLVMLGWINKLGGFLLYAILYTLIFSVVLFYYDQMAHIAADTRERSFIYSYIEPWGEWTMNALGKWIPQLKDVFHDMERFFEKVGTDLTN
jgi:membrane protein required for colicin V production